MMAVLGAVQYKVQKTGPEEAAECGLLQSKRPHATVQDVVAVNKMVGRMKARADRCLPIHSHVGPSLVAVCWEDAAFGNRPDGSSTEGYVVGISTPEILQGEEALVTFADWGSHNKSSSVPVSCSGRGTQHGKRGGPFVGNQIYAGRSIGNGSSR